MLCVWLVHKTLPQQVSTYLSTFLHVASSSDFLFVCLNNVKTWSFFDSISYNRRDLQNNCKASLELHALAYFAVSGFQLMMSLGIYWKTRKLIFLSISYIWRQLGSITFFSCNSPSPSTDTPPIASCKMFIYHVVWVWGGVWLFLCLYLPGVTSLANLDHLSLDYCLRSWDSLLPIPQTDWALCGGAHGASSISQQCIAGCLHFSRVIRLHLLMCGIYE